MSPAEFEPLLSWSFWLIPQEWSSTDPSLVYPSTMTTECYDEQLSDKCLTLLLGTWYEHILTEKTAHAKTQLYFTTRNLRDTEVHDPSASCQNLEKRSSEKIC